MSDYTIAQSLARARQLIEPIDAYAILGQVLSCSREYLISHPEQMLTDAQFCSFELLIMQREDECPLAYVLGHKEFWSMDFKVTPDVLIPRPDTECLVETALQHCPPGARILELATGSGAIACALAHERADVHILATDFSEKALEIAAYNVRNHGLSHIQLLHADWFSGIPADHFDMIIANPPYIAEDDPHLYDELRYEPRSALVSEQSGLADLYHIITEARAYLKKNGILLLEHGYDQGQAVGDFMRASGYRSVCLVQDLSGHERVTYGIV